MINSISRVLALGLFLLIPQQLFAQEGLKGSFIVFVDDHAVIFVNGIRVFRGGLGTARSPETMIKPGDRVVVHLRNDGGPRRFLLAFESLDGKSIASFRAGDFKIVPSVGVFDFQREQFMKWKKSAEKRGGEKALDTNVKNYSQAMWGDLDRCIIACIVEAGMFSQRPR